MASTSKHKRKQYRKFTSLIPDCMNSVIFDAEGITGAARLHDDAKLVVVFGDNASGKSLIFAALRSYIGPREESGAEKITVSMNMRTNGGMACNFMYLDESYSSTGAASLHSVRGAFRTAEARTHPVWLFLDEPDIGMSDRFASAMGAYLAERVNALPEHVCGVALVTHSRPLLRRLLKELNKAPHEISMGQNRSLTEYLDPAEPQEASIDELFAFAKHATSTLKSVASVLRGD